MLTTFKNMHISLQLDNKLFKSSSDGDSHALAQLLSLGADPKEFDSYALLLAARNGHVECVRLLIPISDPKAGESLPLRWAAMNGHVECVRLLIPVSDPSAEDSHALVNAISCNHVECVKLLLPASLLATGCGLLLETALDDGYADIVALFLDREPRLLDGLNLPECLSSALSSGHASLAALLSSIIDREALSTAIPVGETRPAFSLKPRL